MDNPKYDAVKLGGFVLDLEAPNTPGDSWTAGVNFHFKENAAERSGGYAPFITAPGGEKVVFLLNVPEPNNNWWIYVVEAAGAAKVWVTDGANNFDITPAAGDFQVDAIWTGGVLNNIPFFNSSLDGPYYWAFDTAAEVVPLPGWDSLDRCLSMRAHKYHLIAMNITANSQHIPQLVKWSDGADPGALPQTWTPAPDNEAGDVIIAATAGQIFDGAKLRDAFVIYKEHSTYLLEYVGGEFVFEMRPLFATSGIQAVGCAVEDSGFHYVITDTDVIRHDGQSMESIAAWKVKDTMLSSINPENAYLAQAVSRQETDEIWFCIPQQGDESLTGAYIYNTITGEFGIRFLPDPCYYVAPGVIEKSVDNSWDPDTQAWDDDGTRWNTSTYSAGVEKFAAGSDSVVQEIDATPDNDGEPMSAFIERSGYPLGNERETLVTAIYPRISGNAGDLVRIRAGGQSHFNDPVEWGPYQDFIIGDTDKVDCLVHDRFIAFSFESNGGQPWKLHGMTLENTPQGKY